MSRNKWPQCDPTPRPGGVKRCPHGCVVNCEKNAALRRQQGKKLAKRMENLSRDDFEWLYGVGRYAQ